MAAALLICVALLVLAGWAMGIDLIWGYEWPVRVHVAIAWPMVSLIALHLFGVIFTSWQHRENLASALISGGKAAPEPGDVD